MINSGLTLLVPESLLGTALSIYNATQVTVEGATTSAHNAHTGGNPVRRDGREDPLQPLRG